MLDEQGSVVSNPSRIRLVGLPVTTALPATGEDLRTVTADALSVRLLTRPVVHEHAVVGYVQGGFVLDLHDRQSASLVTSVAAVAVAGLIAAALVTLVVTGRSLVPIRRTFDAQARFVADASHELRTPAALIRANAEVLDREALVSEEGQPLLGDIIGEADRLASLVDDLLAMASSDATGLVLQRTSLDVAELVRDTVRGAVALAAQHDVTLVADAPGPAPAQVDRARFTQVLLVLLDNAIDHAPSGSTVTATVRRQDRRVVTTVDDEGPGVARRRTRGHLRALLERFGRPASSPRRYRPRTVDRPADRGRARRHDRGQPGRRATVRASPRRYPGRSRAPSPPGRLVR